MSARLRAHATRLASAPAVDAPGRPQLTSLVDMMVILVVFLLHSFSADGQLVEPAAGIELPASSVETPVPPAVQVVVGRDRILVEGRDVATATSPDLAAAVTTALPRDTTAPCAVQVDRAVPYRVLAAVLAGCSGAGFADVRLVVREVAP